MDILRHGHHVEVLAPVELRREIQKSDANIRCNTLRLLHLTR